MPSRPFILLTNDDGIDAPGLAAAYDAVAPFAEVEIVAPNQERSAASHAMTLRQDMACRLVARNGKAWGYALDGTPVDCVKLAMTELMNRKPDLVIAGINPGANVSNNILYSGTVAAAREGAMLGAPSIAISVDCRHSGPPPTFEAAARFLARLAPLVIARGLPRGVILNVNVPNVPPTEVRGVVVSRQGQLVFLDEHISSQTPSPPGERGRGEGASAVSRQPGVPAASQPPDGVRYKNVGETSVPSSGNPDLDDLVLLENRISVTPLHYDLTHHEFLPVLRGWLEDAEALP